MISAIAMGLGTVAIMFVVLVPLETRLAIGKWLMIIIGFGALITLVGGIISSIDISFEGGVIILLTLILFNLPRRG